MDEVFAIVELMGHKVLAGKLTKAEEFGNPMLRIDVPATSTYPMFTKLVSPQAVYAITYVSQEVAQVTAEACRENPVSVYVPELVKLDYFKQQVEAYKMRLPAGEEGEYGPD